MHLQIATRHVADAVIAMPVGRIDHRSAADFEAELMPLVTAAAAAKGALVLDLSGRRVHQQRRPARADDRGQEDARAQARARSSLRCSSVVRGDLRDQPLQPHPRRAPRRSTTRWRALVRAGARRITAAPALRSAMKRSPLLGYARLAAGCPDRRRRAAEAASRALRAARRAARSPATPDLDQLRRQPAVRGRGTFGGHTSCVELDTGGPEYFVCDMGSGVRPVRPGGDGAAQAASPQTFHIFMSHVHWDHIMGFPFFVPAFIPGNRS